MAQGIVEYQLKAALSKVDADLWVESLEMIIILLIEACLQTAKQREIGKKRLCVAKMDCCLERMSTRHST